MLRYCGYVYDAASELYYCSARYYDYETRQFTSRDPAAADEAESAYQYASGAPTLASDPSGERPIVADGYYARYNHKTKGWDAVPTGSDRPWTPPAAYARMHAGGLPTVPKPSTYADAGKGKYGSGLGGAFGAVKRFAESRAMAAVGNAMGDGLSFDVSDTALLAYLHYQAIDPWAERNPGKYTLAMVGFALLPGQRGEAKLARAGVRGLPKLLGKLGRAGTSGAHRIRGNSALSPRTAYLYRLSNRKTGEYLKTGITQDPMSRYSMSFMEDKKMEVLTSGPRRKILDVERFIVERDPGTLNREPWAGRHAGDVP